jgi:hypothetical protein
MIKNIIDTLNSAPHYGISERVEIAKGKYQIPTTWRMGWNKIKRLWLIRKLKSK